MTCDACQEKLIDYEAELLEPTERAELAQHLLGCAACRAALDQIRLAHAHLSQWPDQPVSPGLEERTLAALEKELNAPSRLRARRLEPEEVFPDRAAMARKPRKLFRPMLTPLAACALLACAGYYAHLSNLQIRLGAEVFGANQLSPDALSLVRLSLFDVADRAPLPNRKVSVNLVDAHLQETELFQGESDADGQVSARLQLPKLPDGAYQLVVRALDGDDATVVASPVTLKRSFRVQLSTDKPMYQPGQTIHARALAFQAAGHKPAQGEAVVFSVLDPKGSRIFKRSVPADAFGVAAFDLPLADQLNLGDYKVSAEVGDTRSDADVQVARYSLPKFEVKVELDKPYVLAGAPATGRIRARYFFGKPVAHAKVALAAGVLVDGFRPVAHQDLETDADGLASFKLALPAALPGTSMAEGNAVLQLSAEVHDTAGEAAEKHAELIVAAHAMALTAVAENGALAADLPNRVLVLVARPDGQPVAKAQVSVDGTGQVALTGDDGVAVVSFQPHGGRRDLSLTAVAPDGERLMRHVELTDTPSFALVRTDKSLYGAGESVKGSVVATSALRMAFLDVISDGRTVLTQTVDLTAGKGEFSFELPAEVSGALSLEVYARNEGAVLRTRRIVFVADPRGLKVDVALAKPSTKPGESATLRLHVADEKGNPTAAGLGISVVDESVFAMASKDPAMLRAFLTLADELRKPRFDLDPTQVVTAGRAQQAADLLFSASELRPTISALGQTKASELGVRRAALAAFKDKRTGTAYFAGLFMLGLMLEGVLRMAAEKLLLGMARTKFGWLALGSGVLFVIADLGTESTAGAAVLSVGVLLAGSGFLVSNRPDGFSWRILISYLGMLLTLFLVTVTTFGDNIRRMFGAGAVCLAGSANAMANAPIKHHPSLMQFAAHTTEDGTGAIPPAAPPAQDFADNLAQHEKMNAGEPVEQLRQRRQQTIQVIKGAQAANGVVGPYGMGAGLLGTVGPTSGGADDAPAPLSAEQKAEVRVRAFFPETLFWAPEVVTDGHGDATVEIPGADSITTWRAGVTATSADGRLGTGQAALQVFQDFFVDIDMPPLLTVGDEVEIPIAVHNDLDHPETVTLEIEPADWLSSSSPRDAKLTLQPGQVAGIKYRFTATRFGPAQALTVYAVGPHGKDAVRREVEVRPAGVAFDQVVNGTALAGATASIALPADAVAGASHAELRVYPSTFSAVMDGLENVLRMPSGCFEQTSSTTYPNALVLRYLRDSKKGSPELLARAEGYLTTGYQRLLSFEVEGGGFEWFGRNPANQVLTAYGLLEFHDMSRVFDIDEKVLARTQEFLVSRQAYDGSWSVDGQSLRDGLYRDEFRGRLTTSAYVTWALAESGYRGSATDRARRYLETHLGSATDTYTLALIANALGTLGSGSAGSAIDLLARRARTGPDHTLFFPADGGTVTSARGGDADVETTALAASALLQAQRGTEALAALKWLLAERDPHGTWSSTQATVLALRALLQAASGAGVGQVHGTLRVTGAGGIKELHFTPDQSDVVQRLDLTSALGSGKLELHFQGEVEVNYQLEVHGYRPRPAEPRPALSLALSYDRAELAVDDTVQAKLTASYQRPEASGMVLIQAAIPPGFESVGADLEKLVASGQIAKYQSDGKQLTFYVDRLTANRPLVLSYGLRARFPVRAVAPSSSAYLYYQPALHAESPPLPLTVSAR